MPCSAKFSMKLQTDILSTDFPKQIILFSSHLIQCYIWYICILIVESRMNTLLGVVSDEFIFFILYILYST